MESFVTKYGSWIFILYIIVGVIPIVKYDTIFNEPFFFAFNYLSIPVFLIAFFFYFKSFPKYRKLAGDVKGGLWLLMLCGLFILMSAGYVMYVNTLIGYQQDTKVEGKIVKLNIDTGGKGGPSYFVHIDNVPTGKELKIKVSKQYFSKLEKGQYYSKVWKKGSLGILYK
jgi:Ca2+/Na+ antiporter